MQQGSEEWLLARVGKVTASRVHDIVATTKSGGYTTGRKNYLAELVCERLTGVPAPQYVSPAMAYGTKTEPEAHFAYALKTGAEIEEVGFIPHPTIIMAGASPDGLVGKDGLVEIKCPNTATHIEMLLHGKVDAYYDQMQFQMACTGRRWCDFVSYDNRMPEPMQLHIIRVLRDDKIIAAMNREVADFIHELDTTIDLLHERYLEEVA
jgi:putative phage-type endonuclease